MLAAVDHVVLGRGRSGGPSVGRWTSSSVAVHFPGGTSGCQYGLDAGQRQVPRPGVGRYTRGSTSIGIPVSGFNGKPLVPFNKHSIPSENVLQTTWIK